MRVRSALPKGPTEGRFGDLIAGKNEWNEGRRTGKRFPGGRFRFGQDGASATSNETLRGRGRTQRFVSGSVFSVGAGRNRPSGKPKNAPAFRCFRNPKIGVSAGKSRLFTGRNRRGGRAADEAPAARRKRWATPSGSRMRWPGCRTPHDFPGCRGSTSPPSPGERPPGETPATRPVPAARRPGSFRPRSPGPARDPPRSNGSGRPAGSRPYRPLHRRRLRFPPWFAGS